MRKKQASLKTTPMVMAEHHFDTRGLEPKIQEVLAENSTLTIEAAKELGVAGLVSMYGIEERLANQLVELAR